MIRTAYIDTSVVGGLFDEEFQLWTKLFFEEVTQGNYKVAVSDILLMELANAPIKVKDYLNKLSNDQIVTINLNEEAEQLANLYLEEKIVGFKSLSDCQHIATSTTHNVEVLVSWNFKHIVNLDKIRLYNSVNLREGYRTIEIRTPRELLHHGN
ncbi:MAG: PIN domain-containing protein [Cyclobacteriaceae bacterium]